ncbi:DUF1871 family protein [Fictibacillus halophilus]|uniref:DUF1871 family protein n=1 Tax=Fictibacillus halophilus TaxID=1610490 RepID=UPI001CFB28D9|nr:DUF1871 family protein [Fictibacillus halophilus]
MNEFSLVKEVINEWDPFDLLAIHCPEDEYDEEIHEIVKVLPNIKDEEELARGIEQIMSKAFDKDFKKSKDCLMIAKKICKLFK